MPYAKGISLNPGLSHAVRSQEGRREPGLRKDPADRPGPGIPVRAGLLLRASVSCSSVMENGGRPQGHWETASSVGLEQSRCFTKVPSLLVSACIPKSPQTPGLGQTLCRCPKLGDGEVVLNSRGPSLPCTCWVRASLDPNQLGSAPTAEQSSSPKCQAGNTCSTKRPRLLATVGSLPSFIH